MAAACEVGDHSRSSDRAGLAPDRRGLSAHSVAGDAASLTGGSAGGGSPSAPDAAEGELPLLIPGDFEATGGQGRHVLLVSFDGLAPRFIDELMAKDELPAFAALRRRSAWTHQARTTPGASVTLPNHFSMITSRPATNADQSSPGRAHGLLINVVLPADQTIHSYGADPYVPSVFDVVHDHGGRTGLFASKEKFRTFADGYGPRLGAPDPYPKDYGKNKVDVVSVVEGASASEVVTTFVNEAASAPLNFAFLHLRETDTAGHTFGWGSPEYLAGLKEMDQALATLLDFLDFAQPYKGNTHLVVTADHGGVELSHGDQTDPLNFTIPLYVAGPSIRKEGDLYSLAGELRAPPPTDQYALANAAPPLRNADAGNLVTTLLGLPEIPNSTMHSFHLRGRWPFKK